LNFFIFLYIAFYKFTEISICSKVLQNYTNATVSNGGCPLPLVPLCGIVALPTAILNGGRDNIFSKNHNFLNSDEDKFYMKIVVFDEIYNSADQTFFI
jgi:hypothetical protein